MKLPKLILLIIFLTSCVYAQPEELTLVDFLKEAKKVNITFQQILIDELQVSFNQRIGLSAADIILSAQGDLVLNTDDGELSANESIGLSQLFPDTGTSWSLSIDNNHSLERSGMYTSFTALISQPLIRNAMGRLHHLQKKQIQINDEMLILQIREAYEDHMASLISLYYDWLLTYVIVDSTRISLIENQKLLRDIQDRYNNKIALLKDVNRIMLQVIEKKEQLITAQKDYANITNQIANALNIQQLNKYRPSLVSNSLYKKKNEDINIIIQKTRQQQINDYLLESNKINNSILKADSLPQLDLFAQLNRLESKQTNSTTTELNIGLSFESNLFQTQKKAEIEKSGWQMEKNRLVNQNKISDLHLRLSQLQENINYYQQVISSTQEKIELSKNIVLEENREYRIGKVSLDQLIRSKDQHDSYLTQLDIYKIKLETNKIEWLRLSDKLLH